VKWKIVLAMAEKKGGKKEMKISSGLLLCDLNLLLVMYQKSASKRNAGLAL